MCGMLPARLRGREQTVETLLVDISTADGVATVTFNRPRRKNAINPTMCRELLGVMEQLGLQDSVRAIVFTGAGSAFCAGGDLHDMREAAIRDPSEGPSSVVERIVTAFNSVLIALRRLPKPAVMAVNGPASGGGTGFALAGDIIIASRQAAFHVPQTRMGLSPDGGTSFFLTRALGPYRATALLLKGGKIRAHEAYDLGIADSVVPDAELMETARSAARGLSKTSATACAKTRMLVDAALCSPLEPHLDREKQAVIECARTREFQRALAVFFETRKEKGRTA